MLQSRLHYLLPAFAAEGLVVAALSAETSQRNQPSPASVQGKRSAEGGSPNRRNLKNLMPMKRSVPRLM